MATSPLIGSLFRVLSQAFNMGKQDLLSLRLGQNATRFRFLRLDPILCYNYFDSICLVSVIFL